MAMTTTTVKTDTGIVISVFNNGILSLESFFDTKYLIQKKNIYNAKGALTEIDTYTYTTANKVDTVSRFDAAGNPMSTDYYVNGLLDHTAKITPINVDSTAPYLIGFSPTDDAVAVPINASLVFTFSEPVQANVGCINIYKNGSFNQAILIADTSRVSFSGNTMTVKPSADFAYGADYSIKMAQGVVVDKVGNGFAGINDNSVFNFTTVGLSDTTAPSLLGVTPTNDAKAVAVNSNIMLTFTESVKAGQGSLSVYNNDGSLAKIISLADTTQVSFSGNMVTINPTTDLVNGKDYYIQIAANAISDAAGNYYSGINNTTSYKFSTVAASAPIPAAKPVDSIAPTIRLFSTSSGQAAANVDSNVLITFSEAIKLGLGKIYLHTGSATGPVVETFDVATSTQIAVSGSNLTIDPSNTLAYASRYYITVDTGAVTDLAGNIYKDMPALTNFSTTSVLTTRPGSWNTTTGFGGIDVLNALDHALGKKIQDVAAATDLSYGLKVAHFEDAWAAGYTGKGQVIAVLDSGIDLKNADLTQHLSKDSFNFVANNTNIQDDFGHGSFVASEITAANNGDNIIGGAYEAELMVLKTTNNLGNATSANVAKAIYYAVDHGADIISMSLNSVLEQPLIKAAFDYAKAHDVLVAVSSGNTLANKPSYPAVYAATNNNVVSVGATFNLNGSEAFSAISGKAGSVKSYNYVDAVGTDVSGYDQNGNIVKMGGTSMATPLVVSEMAILKQALEQVGTYAANVIDDVIMDYVTHDTHSIQLSLLGMSAFTPVDAFVV